MPLSELLQQQLTEIEQQIENLSGKANIEYLLRQRSYLISQSGVTSNNGEVRPTPSPQTGKAQRLRIITVTEPGMTPSGILAFSIKNDGTDTGEVDGSPLEPGAIVSGAATDGNYLVGTPYDPKGQTFQISFIVDVEGSPPPENNYLLINQ